MMFFRPKRLPLALFCALLFAFSAALQGQQTSTPQPAQPQNQADQKQQQSKQPSPFETVPAAPSTPKPAAPAPAGQKQQQTGPKNPFETVPTAPATPQPPPPPPSRVQTVGPAGAPPQNIIEAIEFRGSRRVPQDTLRAMIFSKVGDPYDEAKLQRDFSALWNTGRFDDIRLEREAGTRGWIIRFVVVERPVVRSIKYEGIKSITVSDILDRFKERKVGLVVEQQYDPNKVQRARNVILELLGERGHEYAKVTDEIHRVPPSSLELVFKVEEGPKIKVGHIQIVGNHVFSQRAVIAAMHNLKPIGIPHSILFENIFARTYDASKLEEDKSRVQNFYQEHGYFTARVTDSSVKMRMVGGEGMHIWLIHPNKPSSVADISLTVEEGKLYHLDKIEYTGVKLFRTPSAVLQPLFQMAPGDVFSTAKLRKGLENMRKLYGEFGFIDFVAEPSFDPNPANGTIDLSLAVDEGSQFFVRRIDFSGNTTTRDKVIRRELLIDEGDMYNTRLWELSLLRLNQLGYFEPLKMEDATDVKRDTKTNTVDLTLKVKERGKNSIQLNGGVSGIAGSFVGLSYSTNNFLGLGETLSISSQLGTMLREVRFGFTEPYLFDKPIQTGFTVYTNRFNYDQAREASILAGTNLIPLYNQLGTQNLLNYVSTGYGATVFMSYPLKRFSFSRLALTYGYDISNIQTLTTAANQYFTYLNFQGVSGPNALDGIRTSKITPSFTYNTINNPIKPTGGKSFFLSAGFSGGPLGGNVNTVEPQMEFKYFRKGFKPGNVIGMRLLGRFLTGYGGKVAPPFSRYYMGGDNDVRGFNIWGVSPIAFIPSSANINILNADGTPRVQRILVNGTPQFVPATMAIPTYQLIFPGGDTNLVANFEYRIPLFGPVTLAIFGDAGIDKLSFPSQLTLNTGQISTLNGEFPQAGFTGRAVIAPGTQKMRTSTGLELQIIMPVVNAPFRVWFAYNPTRFDGNLQPPIVAGRSMFPNAATFNNALQTYGNPIPFDEKSTMLRFSVGRTF